MNFAIKYRPKLLKDVVGNERVVKVLKGFLRKGLPKALLFYGRSGCGKTTLANVLANEVGAVVYEYNTANTRGIDTIRNVVEICKYKELSGGKRFFIFDECHQLTNEAQNALLKVLEENDEQNIFVLCTTDRDKLLDTIVGRCVNFLVEPLSYDETIKLIDVIECGEGVSFKDDIKMFVWKKNKGVPRSILNDLEVVVGVDNLKEVKELLKKVDVYEKSDMVELCSLLVSGDFSVGAILNYLKFFKGDEGFGRLCEFAKSYIFSTIINSGEDNFDYYSNLLGLFVKSKNVYEFVFNLSKFIK